MYCVSKSIENICNTFVCLCSVYYSTQYKQNKHIKRNSITLNCHFTGNVAEENIRTTTHTIFIIFIYNSVYGLCVRVAIAFIQ